MLLIKKFKTQCIILFKMCIINQIRDYIINQKSETVLKKAEFSNIVKVLSEFLKILNKSCYDCHVF